MNDKKYEADEQIGLLEIQLQGVKKEYRSHQMTKAQEEQIYEKIREAKQMDTGIKKQSALIKFLPVAAAAVIGIFIILPNTSATIAHAMEQIPVIGSLVKVVTFRDYEYESDRNMADIEVPEIKPELATQDNALQENLDRTTAEINAEIQTITDNLIKEFEDNLKSEGGYQDVVVKSEVLATTPDYFTLKLICYQGAGSGYQWNYFYTIDLKTGERLKLKDIFKEGADYITPISENIKLQM